MKHLLVGILAVLAAGAMAAERPSVLVFTRNGPTLDGKKGYVHDNIPACVKAIKMLGSSNGFDVVVSDEAKIFTPDGLKAFKAVIFANANNTAFDTDAQKTAFQGFIHAGGGFVGIHSASGSERAWPWYWKLLGGTFDFHAPMQKFTLKVVDPEHPSMKSLSGETWTWEDEFYVVKEQPAGLHALMAGDISSLKKGANDKRFAALPKMYPLVWCHEFEGGRSWYTSLGHKPEHYADPKYLKHLLGGIRWAMKMDGTP